MTLYTGITCPDPSFVHTPLIEIRPVHDDKPLCEAIARLSTYDYLLFTSRHAVTHVVAELRTCSEEAEELRLSKEEYSILHSFARKKIVSIGPATSRALRAAGFKELVQVEEDNSHGVIAWFRNQHRGRVLIPRSNLALPIIPDGLRELGFEVDTVTAYETVMPRHPQKVDLDQIDHILFSSPSTIDNFIALYGGLPKDKTFGTRGCITEQYLQTKIMQQL